MPINIDLQKIKGVLVLATIALIAANVVNLLLGEPSWQISRFIGLGEESNFSTWFSSVQLAIAAFLAYQCALKAADKRAEKGLWLATSLMLLAMSCDETAMVHEHLGNLLNKYVFQWGHLRSAWTIFTGPLILPVVIGVTVKLKDYLRESNRGRNLLLGGVCFFIAGAFILDAAINLIPSGRMEGLLKMEILFEESFEMTGVLLIIMGLMEHLKYLVPGHEETELLKQGSAHV